MSPMPWFPWRRPIEAGRLHGAPHWDDNPAGTHWAKIRRDRAKGDNALGTALG